MKQYCRYCSWMIIGDVNWCDKHDKSLSDSTIKTINHCKDFLFTEIDAIDMNKKYKPITKPRIDYSKLQPTLF